MLNVSCENQHRADERIPILHALPFRHKGIMCAPLLGPIELEDYLREGQIEQVICGGENYEGARPCDFSWVQRLHDACVKQNVSFIFIETGTVFVKDGKTYRMPSRRLQSRMAWKSGMYFAGKQIAWQLQDSLGLPVEGIFTPFFGEHCSMCATRPICNGCSRCGACEKSAAKHSGENS